MQQSMYDKIICESDRIVTLYKNGSMHFYMCHIKGAEFSGLYDLDVIDAVSVSKRDVISLNPQIIVNRLIEAIIDGYYIIETTKDRAGDFRVIKKSIFEKFRNILRDEYHKSKVGLNISLRDFIYEIFIHQNNRTIKKLMDDINSYYLPF